MRDFFLPRPLPFIRIWFFRNLPSSRRRPGNEVIRTPGIRSKLHPRLAKSSQTKAPVRKPEASWRQSRSAIMETPHRTNPTNGSVTVNGAAGKADDTVFHPSSATTLGVEIELQILDRD